MTSNNPNEDAAGVQFEAVDRPPVAKHDSTVLDLAFALDCTSSMTSYIHEAQQNIRRIVEEIVSKEKSDIHLALIEYRDHPPQDSSFVTRVHDFTPSVKTMKTWLDGSHARGGGDCPEAVADAWHALLKLSWRQEATKICVHIADAPPHGLGTRGDGFPKGCPDGLDPVVTMNQLAENGVTLYMVGCEPSINSCKSFYMAMAHVTGGQYVPLANARLLTQVIVGGAEEELSLEALMADVEEEVRQERACHGDDIDEEELTTRIHTKMASKGVHSKQLWRNKSALPEVSTHAKAMSKHKNMADMAEVYKTDNPDLEADYGYMFSRKKGRTAGMLTTDSAGGDYGMVVADGVADDVEVDYAAGVDETESYSVESAPVNMMQAQRMVQKAMMRTTKKKKVPTATLR